MAQPAEIVALGEEMAALYRRTQVEVIQELVRIAGMPEQRHYRRKLINQSRELQQYLDQVDAAARVWLQERFPLAYRYGQREADRITGHRSTWTQVHREAVREIAQDTYGNLLEATRYVREDTKRFIRLAVREQSRSVVIAGTRTPVTAGRRDLARQLQEHGINAVRYKNGAKHTLQTYGEMVVRTQTAMAHNMGVLNGAYAGGTRWMECSDGYGCGLTFHEDTDAPAGTVQPIEVAMAYPLSHPNCARSWSPRPDIKDPAEAKAAQRLSDEQLARLGELERERAKVKTVTGRLTGRERMRRKTERRRSRLEARRPASVRAQRPAIQTRFPDGLTTAQAQQWMRERWPNHNIILDGLGDRAANAMARVMDDLMRRYPVTAERVKIFGASSRITNVLNQTEGLHYKKISARAYADAAPKSGAIRLNQTRAKKYDETLALLREDVAAGFHPPGTASIESVVAHEYGHHLKWQAEVGAGGKGQLHEALEEVIARHAVLDPTSTRSAGAQAARARYDTMRGLSRYGATDLDEMAGEALSEVTMSPTPRPFAVDVVKTLVRFAEGAP